MLYGSQVSQLVACAERGIEVHLVVDGISSQRLVDRQVALKASTTNLCRFYALRHRPKLRIAAILSCMAGCYIACDAKTHNIV